MSMNTTYLLLKMGQQQLHELVMAAGSLHLVCTVPGGRAMECAPHDACLIIISLPAVQGVGWYGGHQAQR